ncbi:glutathione S-transferase family protein [Aliikangiella maris]|uniref:Glutathione S-transferase family protein n=2 Tax=Aliikangiella maris TaxID=3162458 RepID=A0ABV2BTH9_9GAMM
MYTVYGDIKSGNCYKVYLLMNLLQLEFKWQHVDILKQEASTAQFKAMNANAKVPVLKIHPNQYLSESNAILNFLANGTNWLPQDPFTRAKILEWQFFEQYSHEPYIAVARFINQYLGLPKDREAEYASKQAGGNKALTIMEAHLSKQDYFVNQQYTIADISLFAYTHVAHEGGFNLSQYPAVGAWINRIQSHPFHQPMALKTTHND